MCRRSSWQCDEDQRAGERDFERFGRADYSRWRYAEKDECYFEGYDAAERAEERRQEERRQEQAEEERYERRRREERAYEEAMFENMSEE